MNMKELTRIVIIALIFFGIGAAAAESNLRTFKLRADEVLTDYIGGNATANKVNVTGLIIQAGQVLGYYNGSVTDGLLGGKANLTHNHSLGVGNVSGLQGTLEDKANASDLTNHTSNSSNPHNVTASQVGAAASSHGHSGDNITSAVASATNADMVDGKHYSNISSEIDSNISTHAGNASAHHLKTTSVGDLTDHNTANHNSLNIDADTVGGIPSTGFAKSSSSTYTGDGTANRSIAHGLGRVPDQVIIQSEYDSVGYWFGSVSDTHVWSLRTDDVYRVGIIAGWNSTDFQVGYNVIGEGFNQNNIVFHWSAYG